MRWITVLDAATAARYAAVVGRLAPCIEDALGPEVVANRVDLARSPPPSLRLRPWRPARARFLAAARDSAASAGALLVADVRHCYGSMGPDRVRDALERMSCRSRDVVPVLAMISRFAREGVTGLPVGPAPSAVLANAVLARPDEAIRSTGAAHLRWVDDFWVFVPHVHAAYSALMSLRDSLAAAGLSLAEEKTRVLASEDEIAAFVARGSVSDGGSRYHRPSDAHPLSGVDGAHPVVPARGGVDPGRWPPRAAGGNG